MMELAFSRWDATTDAFRYSTLRSVLAAVTLALVGVAATVPALGAAVYPDGQGRAEVRTVSPGSTAGELGLQAGDLIETVNGRPVEAAGAIDHAIQETGGATPRLGVLRGGVPLELARADSPPTLGVLLHESSLDHPGAQGATIERVYAGGAADRAGVRPGDRVYSVDGVPVWAYESNRSLAFAARLSNPEADVVIDRDGRRFGVRAALGGQGPAEKLLGFEVEPDAPLAASANIHASWLRPERGIRVTSVAPGGPAERAGVRPGDVIAVVGRRFVANADGLRYALGTSSAQLGEPALVVLERAGAKIETEVSLAAPSRSGGLVRALPAR